MAHKITAFVLTYNAEKYLKGCLESLMWADEVMIVDSFSADKTVEIAQSLGVRVLQNAWPGYGLQLQFALNNASHDWVFFTDQDEVVTLELAQNIRKLMESTPHYLAYRIKRQNALLGHWLKYGGSIEKNIRLVNRNQVSYCDSQHTYICEDVKRATLEGVVRHDMAPTLDFWWGKSFKLATIEAEVDYEKGARFSAWKTAGAFWKFIRRYIFKLGFLDGWAGLYMALQRSIYILVYQACLLELKRGVRQPKENPHTTKFR
ncbi:glycosyltransferase family 2 protein [Thiosulfativibrio zosterae]|uniref:LPS biosynthesis protein n=1 Tax=Thiosulfativibrio zosterae TaxID=2675053 RepID=A0A6F8PPM0_9GAMM|nr:glycosyltransferase family 2 protein [Thiosulfativibrio zosterae]BBP44026.1 LPS biosynthesis protein [Thiosulfativibrio zosterae]